MASPIFGSLSQSDLFILTSLFALAIYFLANRLLSDPAQSSPAHHPLRFFHRLFSAAHQPLSQSQSLSPPASSVPQTSNASLLVNNRDFVARMQTQNKKIIVFYGSQTGTAEDYATRLAKEAKARFGLSSLVVDPDEYDFDNLDQLTSDHLVIFALATYGEGEPTDNAVSLYEFLNDESNCSNLSQLRYVLFALGDRTYEQFCAMGKNVDALLSKRGAVRLGELGMGDDDKSMEEDYLAWKDLMWEEVQTSMGWEEGGGGDEADFKVQEVETDQTLPGLQIKEPQIFRGELSTRALLGTRGVVDAKNPFPARVVDSRELFQGGDRNCVHISFDIRDTGIRYQAGDHLAVWPINPDSEVERLMKLLGLWDKREVGIQVTSLDPMLARVPFPSPASYDAIFRHYLDISSTVSRQLLGSLARFAPTPEASETLRALGTDKELYMSRVAALGLRLGETLMMVTSEQGNASLSTEDPLDKVFGHDWLHQWKIPMDRIIGGLPRLQPRFYSISSSPKLYPDQVHITAVVLKYPSGDRLIHGCGTNYLLNAKMYLHGGSSEMEHQAIDQRRVGGNPKYRLEGPRGKYLVTSIDEQNPGVEQRILRIPVHVRRSNFRLPTSPKIPVIMIGPGTGVAPFRSFVQERVGLARKTKSKYKELSSAADDTVNGKEALKDWAKMILFYGCRNEDVDFLYKDEWGGYAEELCGKFEMYTAVSRRPGNESKKEYVQDLMRSHKETIKKIINQEKGYIFICGDGKNMLRGVEEVLKNEILGDEAAGRDGGQELKFLKDRNRLLLDVWS